MSENIKIELSDHVLTLTLHAPERLNALTKPMLVALLNALNAARDDARVRVVVITGSGRAFSAGQDLAEALPTDAQGKPDLKQALLHYYNPLIETLYFYPKVTIAAVHGAAVGAAVNLGLACDIIVASSAAYFQQGFVKIGLIPDAGGTFLLPRLVGMQRALGLMLTADKIMAEEAQQMGLVYKIFPEEDFMPHTRQFAQSLAQGALSAQKLIKQAVRGIPETAAPMHLGEALNQEAVLQSIAGRSEAFKEGVQAFLEKRIPDFNAS
jgi:2-(1,2-epoxy-1,2-dihydrophenyl)acetyl-CoA isomerase